MPLARTVARRFAKWAIPKLESFVRLGKPIVSLTYLRREPPKVLNLIYRIDIVNPVPEDVAKQELTYTLDGGAPIVQPVLSGDLVKFPESAHVVGFVTAFDAVGNAGEPSDLFDFIAAVPDTTGPGKPTVVFTFVGTEEVPVEPTPE